MPANEPVFILSLTIKTITVSMERRIFPMKTAREIDAFFHVDPSFPLFFLFSRMHGADMSFCLSEEVEG